MLFFLPQPNRPRTSVFQFSEGVDIVRGIYPFLRLDQIHIRFLDITPLNIARFRQFNPD